MDVFDLILEAVENSVEAGAGIISVVAEEEDGECRVRVEDDGDSAIPEDPFRPGCTTKGCGRGEGLARICSSSGGRCTLIRRDGRTMLEFIAGGRIPRGGLDGSLLPIFLFPAEISMTINISGRSVRLSTGELREGNAFPDRAGAIGRFRKMVRQKEGEIYG